MGLLLVLWAKVDEETFSELPMGFYKALLLGLYPLDFLSKQKSWLFILAIEKIHEIGWASIWKESDSTYVVNLFNAGSGKIHWRLTNRWHRAMTLAKSLKVAQSQSNM